MKKFDTSNAHQWKTGRVTKRRNLHHSCSRKGNQCVHIDRTQGWRRVLEYRRSMDTATRDQWASSTITKRRPQPQYNSAFTLHMEKKNEMTKQQIDTGSKQTTIREHYRKMALSKMNSAYYSIWRRGKIRAVWSQWITRKPCYRKVSAGQMLSRNGCSECTGLLPFN